MKKNIVVLSVLILLISFGCSKNYSVLENKDENLSYVNSKSFMKVKKTFSIEKSNLSLDESFNVFNEFNNNIDILIIPVYDNGHQIAYLWTYHNTKDNTYSSFYETLVFKNSVLQSASLFTESKFLLVEFDFQKTDKGLRYTIKDKPDTSNNIKTLSNSSLAVKPESYTDCVTRVYQTAKKACEGDPTCDTLCDFTPGCHASMLAAAAVTCINTSSEPNN